MFSTTRPLSFHHCLVAALLVCIASPSAIAATPWLQPSVSATVDRDIDRIMPPLSTIAASPSTIGAQSVSTAQAAGLATFASRAFPQVTTEFKQFLDQQAALGYTARGASAKVSDPVAFAQMQRYLFNRYNGVTVVRSLRQGQKVFDCIPTAQQPGLRTGESIATPPDSSAPGSATETVSAAQRCDAGTVPLERIGLADLASHANLQSFLKAGEHPAAAQPIEKPPATSGNFYSKVSLNTPRSSVSGAGLDLNTWAPALRNSNETQSISQIWYVGNSAKGKLQTLEAGWQVQPAAGWGNKPAVFVYSTQDGYESTGCSNLKCGIFVQTSSGNVLGVAPAGGFSVAGGKQVVLSMEFQRKTDGNWWVRVNGEWIGYYKAALFSGDLAQGKLLDVSAGGETSTDDGKAAPMMGSGKFASAGYKQAAFQANHFYRDAAGTVHPIKALNSVDVENPSCYTLAIAGLSYSGTDKGVSKVALSPEMKSGGFYFGGPGCQ